jgi:hypothetical protein
MTPRDEEPQGYQLPHIRIERFRRETVYSPPQKAIDPKPAPNNTTHGRSLKRQFSAAYARARALVAARRTRDYGPIAGVYLEVFSASHRNLGDLTWEQKGIRAGALRVDENDIQKATLFIPEGTDEFIKGRLDRYIVAPEQGKRASLADRFDDIEGIREAPLNSLWTDSREFPQDNNQRLWWECWTWTDAVPKLEQVATRLELLVSQRRLIFPEIQIVPIYASSTQIDHLAYSSGAIEQLRYASDSPSFFTTTVRREQDVWVEELRARIHGPNEPCPAVCLLDGGVAQAHPLINIALENTDCLTVDPQWGTTDDSQHGHGTNMAGGILYGDLTFPLADRRIIELDFKLESVKFLPPPGFVPTDPENYGSITQSAVSTAEIHAPERDRVFCMAVTNKDVSGERPTSWSAALDQAASGAMVGDREDVNAIGPRRLFFVSGGNIPDSADPDEVSDIDEFPTEDPAQAWNVVTVGGFTEKNEIDQADGYPGWMPVAEAGDLSPYSRISTDWEHSRTPIKPEIVFEAGNKAISPEQNELLSGLDSLSLLTTNRDFTRNSLETYWATSAATAQAAGMAGTLIARFPNFWLETIRALMVHSAEWTPAMLRRLQEVRTKHEKVMVARHFGYGVPSLYRALASAQNDLVLLAEREFTPYQRRKVENERGKVETKAPSFRQIDYYDLPWPVAGLEELGEKDVVLKVTLSYFIEPSPNWDASISPQRYQSFGLRFDLKRADETEPMFHQRINALERNDGQRTAAIPDEGWTFGSQSIAAGSLHCDVWKGTAANLAARGKIAVYPVGGWWRDRVRLKRSDAKTRYSLAVSITSEEQDVSLYNEITNLISISQSV